MATYLYSTAVTTLGPGSGGARTPLNGDSIVVTASGAVVAPTQTIDATATPAALTITVSVMGYLELDLIALNGGDQISVSAQGFLDLHDTVTGIQTGLGSGPTHITNAGTLTAVHGLAIWARATNDTIINTGTITADTAVVMGRYGFAGNHLLNSGLITTMQTAVRMLGNDNHVINSGEIHSNLNAAIRADGDNGATAATQTIDNSGLLTSDGAATVLINLGLANSVTHLQNDGVISNTQYAIQSIGPSIDRIINTGTIIGGVDLGSGNDTFDNHGGQVSGSIFLGAGDDTVDLRGGALTGFAYGGIGGDVYFVDDSATTIIESDLSIDIVFAQCDFVLAGNVDWLTQAGGGNFTGIGNSGANQLTGNLGDNRLIGLDGLDTIFGGFGDDRLNGGGQNDTLMGDDGDDRLLGGLGADTMRGGDGDDTLIGGIGKDQMFGDDGSDTFLFTTLAQSGATVASADIIADFTRGDDHIDLSVIDANTTNTNPNDSFSFISNSAFSGVAGQVHIVVGSGFLTVEMDVNADAVADFAIRINGLTALTADDFVL